MFTLKRFAFLFAAAIVLLAGCEPSSHANDFPKCGCPPKPTDLAVTYTITDSAGETRELTRSIDASRVDFRGHGDAYWPEIDRTLRSHVYEVTVNGDTYFSWEKPAVDDDPFFAFTTCEDAKRGFPTTTLEWFVGHPTAVKNDEDVDAWFEQTTRWRQSVNGCYGNHSHEFRSDR